MKEGEAAVVLGPSASFRPAVLHASCRRVFRGGSSSEDACRRSGFGHMGGTSGAEGKTGGEAAAVARWVGSRGDR